MSVVLGEAAQHSNADTKSAHIGVGAWPPAFETLGRGKLAPHFAQFPLARAERIDDIWVELLA